MSQKERTFAGPAEFAPSTKTISAPRHMLRQGTEIAGSLLFPRRCPLCRGILGAAVLCPSCENEENALRHIPPRLPDTEHLLEGLSGAACAYHYSGAVKEGIRSMKYHGRFWAVRGFALQMAVLEFGCTFSCKSGILKQNEEVLPNAGFSCVVPVPPSIPHSGPHLPGQLAKQLSAMLGIPVVSALEKTRNTPRQATLNGQERLANLRGAFRVKAKLASQIENCRILLVDDVITTGATVSACAEVLNLAGADTVFAVAIAAAGEDFDAKS